MLIEGEPSGLLPKTYRSGSYILDKHGGKWAVNNMSCHQWESGGRELITGKYSIVYWKYVKVFGFDKRVQYYVPWGENLRLRMGLGVYKV